jgi:hypothetical protein
MGNAKSYKSKSNLAIKEELPLKYIVYLYFNFDITLSDFFLFG